MKVETLNVITWVLTAIVIIADIWAIAYFFKQKKADKLIEKTRWINNSTLAFDSKA